MVQVLKAGLHQTAAFFPLGSPETEKEIIMSLRSSQLVVIHSHIQEC